MRKMTEDDIRCFVEDKKQACRSMLMEEIIDDLSTDTCKVLCAFVGLNPKSSQYGYILGAFRYVVDDTVHAFRFYVHIPEQKFAVLSNRMTDCCQIVPRTFYDVTSYDTHEELCLGLEAFDRSRPDKDLNESALALRLLMKNIRDYSRSKDLCKVLRKTDRSYLKIRRKEEK